MFDVVVIGAGMAGSAAAYYLTKEGCGRLLVVERHVVATPRGSSYGESRMYELSKCELSRGLIINYRACMYV
jgi:glycine/D-amino acid oxidase-like deaminating enzyme